MTRDAISPLSFQILLSLADRARYGYEMIHEIERQTEGAMVPKTGSLYVALQRLEQAGLIQIDDRAREPDEDERRLYYGLTAPGRTSLAAEISRLERLLQVAERKRTAAPGLRLRES